MNIGGFQKNSLIDFPGTIACIVFTQGCNFVCPYCHNPDLVTKPKKMAASTGKGNDHVFEEDKIFEFLFKRKGLLEGVVITGGEPTLQTDLVEFCRKVKTFGYRLKMDTNGTNPEVLTQLFEDGLLDYVAMDIKTHLKEYHRVWPSKKNIGNNTDKIVDSIRLIMSKAPAYEFRTTCVKPFISNKIIQNIGETIKGANLYILQNCSKNVTVLDPEFLKNGDPFFSETQMKELKEIAGKYVAASTIR
ncbi:MAG: anaerobic ribonucleoside-triphosphate reductase activating protein [Desulfobacula sp.]|nr:anaerobic ribonucleoside-triphosphate reductase activating protein [Desulfobacula sp.]